MLLLQNGLLAIHCGSRVCRVSSFNDLHDLARDFNVKSAVIDIKPETRKVREFQRSETFSVFACDYVETKTSMTYWDEKDKVIKCNRTEICDATHELVTQQGRLVLPRRNEELSVFAKQMCHMAKVIEEDSDTGARVARYKGKIGGPDDYRHAMNYCFLASERIGIVSDRNLISKFFNSRRRRTWMTS